VKRRVFRSTTDKVIGGVCSGLAEYFGIDPTWVRILFVLSIFAHGVGLLAYVIGWIVIPRETEIHPAVAPQTPQADGQGPDSGGTDLAASKPRGAGFLPGIILVILGMVFLFDRAFYWFDFDYVWPAILIGIGVMLLYRSSSPKADRGTSTTALNDSVEVENGSR
jgi:phage shock protein PspC (stress-responsive transcriptional regulator)